MKIVIWAVLIFLALFLMTRSSGFVQQFPLDLDAANQNVLEFSKVLSSCGNVKIPWNTCEGAFAGLPVQMSSIFKDTMKSKMCNNDGTVNEDKLYKFISCPK